MKADKALSDPKELKRVSEKYKCEPTKTGGWCNGIKVGSRMRCPYHSLARGNSERLCHIGIEMVV